jgi:hypothetical protein
VHKRIPLALVLLSLVILFSTGFNLSKAEAADYQTSPPDLEWLEFINVESELYLDDDVIILNAADGGYYLVHDNTPIFLYANPFLKKTLTTSKATATTSPASPKSPIKAPI